MMDRHDTTIVRPLLLPLLLLHTRTHKQMGEDRHKLLRVSPRKGHAGNVNRVVVRVNTQGRESRGSWFETCSGMWYPRRGPCRVAIDALVDLNTLTGESPSIVSQSEVGCSQSPFVGLLCWLQRSSDIRIHLCCCCIARRSTV